MDVSEIPVMPQKQFSFLNVFVLLLVSFLSAIPGLLIFYFSSNLGFWTISASVLITWVGAMYGPALFIRLRSPLQLAAQKQDTEQNGTLNNPQRGCFKGSKS